MQLKPAGCGCTSMNSISSASPGWTPFTYTGPVSGWIARLEDDLLAFAHLEHRFDIRVVAVVAGVRLRCEGLTAIDANGVHGDPPRCASAGC